MPARLVALNGTGDLVLSELLTIVGRHETCNARLDSSRVSRRHCCLAFDDGEVLVRDLGSHNGTWINNQKIEVGVLRPGDVLGIAHLKFRLIELTPRRPTAQEIRSSSPEVGTGGSNSHPQCKTASELVTVEGDDTPQREEPQGE